MFASGKNGITGTGLTLPPEITKNHTKYIKSMLVNTLEIRQQMTVVPER